MGVVPSPEADREGGTASAAEGSITLHQTQAVSQLDDWLFRMVGLKICTIPVPAVTYFYMLICMVGLKCGANRKLSAIAFPFKSSMPRILLLEHDVVRMAIFGPAFES